MRQRMVALVGAALLTGGLVAEASPPDRRLTRFELVEVFSEDGTITRVRVPVRPATPRLPVRALAGTGVTALQRTGPTDTKLDLVFVGDGYRAGERLRFHDHVRRHVSAMFRIEPFRNYQSLFNVWTVDVVSDDSGVDNDPTPGVARDTALDMEFWCNGTERLLCVDTGKAQQFAELAPDADQVIAIANSTKYGGAGGSVATASGGNSDSSQVLVHELGHSIGKLADEYDSAYIPFIGVEPVEANVTVYSEPLMVREQAKWYRWLGQTSPDGGTVGSYLGARYNPVLYWRPTTNSLMRSLNREFNLPSREAMVLAFYDHARPVASVSPAAGAVSRKARLALTLAQPRTHALRVTWRVDGAVVARDRAILDLATLRLSGGRTHTVQAVVEDPTTWVLSGPARERLRETLTWTAR
jgi:hypothetical protein